MEGNGAKLEGVFEKMEAYYADKSVALFETHASSQAIMRFYRKELSTKK